MAFVEEATNTPAGGGIRWFLPEGTSVASATTVSFAGINSAVILTGSTPIQTISGTVPGEVFVVRPGVGSTITFTTGGNIARAATLLVNQTYLLWNDGGTIYATALNNASDVPFTSNGDIAATTVQTAIVEVRDDTDTKLTLKVAKAGDTMTGPLLMGDGTSANPFLALSGDPNTGWKGNSTEKRWIFVSDGADYFMLDANALRAAAAAQFEFSSTSDPTAAADLLLKRGAARRFDVQADGTNVATIRIVGNGTTGTQYIDLYNDGSGSFLNCAGTGYIHLNSPSGVVLRYNGANRWLSGDGTFLPAANLSYKVGGASNILAEVHSATHLSGNSRGLASGAATGFVRIGVANNFYTGGMIFYSIVCSNATDYQCRAGSVPFALTNDTGVETGTMGTPNDVVNVTVGTLTATFGTVNTTANTMDIQVTATSSLAAVTNFVILFQVLSPQAPTVTLI